MDLPLFSSYPSLHFPALILAEEWQPSADLLHPGASKMLHSPRLEVGMQAWWTNRALDHIKMVLI